MSTSAEQLFTKFCNSISFPEIQQLFTELCSKLGVDPNQYEGFYASVKKSLKHWKAASLFKLLDARASLPEYNGQRACAGKRVLVVGAGPVGLRGAIELALLGARVDLVEKREEFTRNNCLHLWQFCISDLRNLGAKVLYSRFAYGTIEHISTKFLQSILLKICLLLGVKVHRGVSFDEIIEPDEAGNGWRVATTPTIPSLSTSDLDFILAADGNKRTLPGFRSRVFRPKLALGITINFVNNNTSKDSAVKELGGLSVMHCSNAFASLVECGIELENIIYFKDETHYFVMTAKKASLLKKGVLKENYKDVRELLKRDNVVNKTLASFAAEAAITCSGLQDPEIVINHRGEKDVALFDFTTMHESENASRIIERKGKKILLCVAGDTLLQPFWPSGTGCNRGFLGAFDAAWLFKGLCSEGADCIELLKERESILTLLPQTYPHSLQSNFAGYTLDPKTRYRPGGLRMLVPRMDVKQLYDCDTLPKTECPGRPGFVEVGVSHDSSDSDEDRSSSSTESLHEPAEVPPATSELSCTDIKCEC